MATVCSASGNPGISVEVRQPVKADFHDRFIVIDRNECIYVGASIKDAGKTAFMVSKLEDDVNRQALLASIKSSWDSAGIVP